VWPPDDVLDAIAGLPRPSMSGVRWSTRDQWHVTLRFLGDAAVDDTMAALDEVSGCATEALLGPMVQRLGRGVLCLPVDGLAALAAAVQQVTAGLGKPLEHRRFRGHVTLARLTGAAPTIDAGISCRWTVATFALVRSRLGSGPARYETIAEWELPQ
jgi:RNA 2',3'-cyclic 3'-phosphodiesterase